MSHLATVCETEYVFHNLFDHQQEKLDAILENGLRPLSDFPDSPRWQQLEQMMPGFYQKLYEDIAAPILKKPYHNSGVFISQIDFHLLPGTYLHGKPRFRIPVTRLDPDYSCLTYVIDENRISLPLTAENMVEAAAIWTEEMVREWFGKDNTKVFYYVPQIATYQPGGVPVQASDLEYL